MEDKDIDEFLLQFLAHGHKTLTVTFSGEIGDDTRVFQMPYSLFKRALKHLIATETTKARIDELERADGFTEASYTTKRLAKLQELLK